MPSSGIIDLVIGLTFVFGVTAALASAVTELISRWLGLRGAYLLTGLRELVDSGNVSTDLSQANSAYHEMQEMMRTGQAPAAPAQPPSATGALLGGPILSSQGMTGQISTRRLTLEPAGKEGHLPKMTADRQAGSLWEQRRSLPSYISSKSFAEAVVDLVVPDAAGQTSMDVIRTNVQALPDSPLRQSLLALVKNADNDMGQFRTGIERWYDDHMDRVSGWYKRHVAKITLAAGAILVVLLNINALTIGRTLYTESAVSSAVSTVAAKVTSCSATESRPECLANLEGQLSAAAAAGLPIGWGTVRDCTEPNAQCNWLDQRGIFSLARQFRLAAGARAHWLPHHGHRDCPWRPVLVWPAEQNRQPEHDRAEARRGRILTGAGQYGLPGWRAFAADMKAFLPQPRLRASAEVTLVTVPGPAQPGSLYIPDTARHAAP